MTNEIFKWNSSKDTFDYTGRSYILEKIAEVGKFDSGTGTGIAFQLDVEDAVGVAHQVEKLSHVVEEEL